MDHTALVVFTVTIALVIWGIIDRSLVALLGALALGLTGVLSFHEAIAYVDWDVVSILLGMWILAEYMSGAGISDIIVGWASSHSSRFIDFVFIVSVLAGFLSLFVDNVLIVILFGGIIARAAHSKGLDPLLPVVLLALNANFMGTALLLGDLPPQLLHSVAKAEFVDFIWMDGRPSSFPLLTITYLVLNYIIYRWLKRTLPHSSELHGSTVNTSSRSVRRGQLFLSLSMFIVTITGMAFRREISVFIGYDVKLGEIALAGGLTTAFLAEVSALGSRDYERFEDILKRVEWNALLFYISLFILVGGLEKAGYIDYMAHELSLRIAREPLFYSYTLLYWCTGIASSVIEHDALILSLLKVVRDLSTMTGMYPWPLYWAIAWGGTLGSNATLAGAPAIYVGVLISSRVSGRKYRGLTVLKYTLPYALASLFIHYIVSIIVWAS